jgi:dTDP-4-dehydrorhamnose 3,5-epimerase|tara:strand:+ start:647 stop:1174 length:528 start_codon:yes stop_codon:yes gene_type:complete
VIFKKTNIDGVYNISIEKIEDNRGFFARTWDSEEFKNHDLVSNFVQSSISFNKKKGTIRGMHFQLPPHGETKIVNCFRGKIFDVLIDLRKNSPTFKKWESYELSSENYNMLYIPQGIAHGFQTLEDNSEIYYQMSEFYKPEFYHGVRFDDPNFGIKWPHEITEISEKDKNWKTFN